MTPAAFIDANGVDWWDVPTKSGRRVLMNMDPADYPAFERRKLLEQGWREVAERSDSPLREEVKMR